MSAYIVKRVLWLVPVIFLVSFLTFSLSYFSPSDPITARYTSMGITPDPEILEHEKQEAGLNDPFLTQYIRWLTNALRGDFGESYSYGDDAATEILKRLPNTLKLAVATLVCTILLSVPLGILSTVCQDGLMDYFLRFVSFLGVSMPSFWVAMLLMYAFGVKMKLLPVMGSGTPKHLILPCITLTFWLTAIYVRRLRGSMLEEMNRNYVRGMLARGFSKSRILWRHVLPNSLLSVITMLGVSIGMLLGGTTVVETVFEWQGIGKMVVAAIGVRDYPIIMGYVVWVSAIYVVVNLLTDLICHFLDPRIRLGEKT